MHLDKLTYILKHSEKYVQVSTCIKQSNTTEFFNTVIFSFYSQLTKYLQSLERNISLVCMSTTQQRDRIGSDRYLISINMCTRVRACVCSRGTCRKKKKKNERFTETHIS